MKKSNLKLMCYLHGREEVAKHIGKSYTTICAWIKRGYATPKYIQKLTEYPNNTTTVDELKQDVKNNFDKGDKK